MSLFRKPGTKHFQLVYRSRRDPLVDGSERVLKEVGSSQAKRGKDVEEEDEDEAGAGDAASYGIYYDDSQYNYMQHLRQTGGIDSFLVEAPVSKKGKGKAKREDDGGAGGFTMRDLPDDALPSHPLDEVSYTDLTSAQGTTMGLQPDMPPSIREVLEALDDEAYAIDDGEGTDGEDTFWSNVVEGGEKEEWENESDYEDEEGDTVETPAEPEGWEARVAQFKAAQKGSREGDSDDGETEGGDTIADLRASNARRPPRKVGKSQSGSQFSMTSSAMFRNKGLQTLDEQFDQIEKMYNEDSDSSWGGDSDEEEDDDDEDAPQLIPHMREDLDEIMDDFLSRYEVLGGKIRPVLEPSVGVEGGAGKLDRIRRELASLDIGDEVEEGEDPIKTARRREKEKILEAVERQELEELNKKDKIRMHWEKPKERWDCETVLSTYSNVSNHPRLLRFRDMGGPRPARIRIDPKTGFPVVEESKESKEIEIVEDQDGLEEDDEDDMVRDTIKRPRNESAEDRKARKDAIKAERLARRNEKTATKEAFSVETKRQNKAAAKAVAGGKAADIKSPNSPSPVPLGFALARPIMPKRVLLALAPAQQPARAEISHSTVAPVPGEIGRLETVGTSGAHVLIIQLSRFFLIGRSDRCDYQIASLAVSKLHCRLYALESDTGEVIVAMEDTSSNGTMHNNRRLSKQSVILSDGDTIEVGSKRLSDVVGRALADEVQGFVYLHSSQRGSAGELTQEPQVEEEAQRIGDYVVSDRLLGSGAFCVVRLALNTKTLKQVACKVLKRSMVSKHSLEDLKREVGILKSLSHPNINRIEEIGVSELKVVSGGDLFSYLVKNVQLSAAECKWIMYQLLLAVEYLHEIGNVAHRDIKLENVILETARPFPKVLLADFGQACMSRDLFTSLTGTPIYMAPEALAAQSRREGYDGKLADVWALGCILFATLTGSHPFDDRLGHFQGRSQLDPLSPSLFGESAEGIIEEMEQATCANILRGTINLPSSALGSHDLEGMVSKLILPPLTITVRDLIKRLLRVEPKFRSTARQALGDAWFRASQSELVELYAATVTARA